MHLWILQNFNSCSFLYTVEVWLFQSGMKVISIELCTQCLRSLLLLFFSFFFFCFLFFCMYNLCAAELQRRIQAMEMRCYLKILHISYKDHVTNE